MFEGRARRAGMSAIASLALLCTAAGATVSDEMAALFRRSDLSADAPAAFRALLQVSVTGRQGDTRLEVWKGEGERALVRFLDPREAGKYLLQRPEGLYFISPGAAKPVRMDRSYRLWGGPSLEEMLGLRYGEDFRLTGAEPVGAGQVAFQLEAVAGDAPYPRARYVVRRDLERPLRVEHLLPSGKVARILEFSAWQDGDALRPRRLVIKDPLRGGPPTEVEFLELEERQPPAGIFELDGRAARQALGE